MSIIRSPLKALRVLDMICIHHFTSLTSVLFLVVTFHLPVGIFLHPDRMDDLT